MFRQQCSLCVRHNLFYLLQFGDFGKNYIETGK